MFDKARVFGLPPGADFATRLAQGIRNRLRGSEPESLARVTVFVNTQRLRLRLRDALMQHGATFLPRLRLVTEISIEPTLTDSPAIVSPLGRRLELAALIGRLLQVEPDLAPSSALYDLSDSLAKLMAELKAEGVSPDRLAALDMGGHAAHWARSRKFIDLVARFFGPDVSPDAEARLRQAVESLGEAWQRNPPEEPVIIAGSSGSRGTTRMLMRTVLSLPQGALVLPGFDFHLPEAAWRAMDAKPALEDHPQYRYRHLMQEFGLSSGQIQPWDDLLAPAPERNRLFSLALRPAPVTDQWINEGPGLGDLTPLAEHMALIEAPDPRTEAVTIALALRQALGEGKRAALITPDRDLARRVAAALDRWHIRPDDSAGMPLGQSPPGRLLRLIARAMGERLAVDDCLALLKHPLAFTGTDRGQHLLLLRELELSLRRRGPALPDRAALGQWATEWQRKHPDSLAPLWADRVGALLDALADTTTAPLSELIAHHQALAQSLSAGTGEGSGKLWEGEAGEAALSAMGELAREAPDGFTLPLADYASLIDGVFGAGLVRETFAAERRIEILGIQETRAQAADLVILGGLNEGIWPEQPPPDPWLNRRMRLEAGLLLPERRIGLAAHDFQMAAAAPEIILSRALHDSEAETVPSRWLNRLTNLLNGLEPGGQRTLSAMRARGEALIAAAGAIERPVPAQPAARPSPQPPVAARPRRLSLTRIETLIRDPYAIYAQYVLKLRALPPLHPLADARLRGEVLHKVPERLLLQPLPNRDAALLMRITDEVLAESVPWPAMRLLWRARMAEIAEPFIQALLNDGGQPISLEKTYEVAIPGLDFHLVGKPDRLDLMEDGRLRIVDYKTGTLPSAKQQESFAKQLHLAAVMASLGAFPEVGRQQSARIVYLALNREMKKIASDLTAQDIIHTLDEFHRLIAAYDTRTQGYTARRAVFETRFRGDYDDLARHGEWDGTTPPEPEEVG